MTIWRASPAGNRFAMANLQAGLMLCLQTDQCFNRHNIFSFFFFERFSAQAGCR
jgi:hypothetical protein